MRAARSIAAAGMAAVGYLFEFGLALAGAAEGRPIEHYLLYSGFDLWRSGASAHGGLLWSPNGIAREGFTLKVLFAGGTYRYHTVASPVAGKYVLGSVMGGWRFKRDQVEVTVFAGPDFQSHGLTPDDPGNRMRGMRAGLRVGGDLWYQPTATFMSTVSVSASTIGPNYWTRAAIGWRMFDCLWFGPELLALGGDRYHQFRAGLHATALRTLAFEWSAGLGIARDSEHRDGLYARIGVLTRR
jgi:hypothetical protein